MSQTVVHSTHDDPVHCLLSVVVVVVVWLCPFFVNFDFPTPALYNGDATTLQFCNPLLMSLLCTCPFVLPLSYVLSDSTTEVSTSQSGVRMDPDAICPRETKSGMTLGCQDNSPSRSGIFWPVQCGSTRFVGLFGGWEYQC